MAAAVISRNRSSEVSLIMTRASSGSSLFDDSRMDKTLLLNLELKRNERRRNLRYRNSATWDSENVKQNQVCPDLPMIFNSLCFHDLKFGVVHKLSYACFTVFDHPTTFGVIQ